MSVQRPPRAKDGTRRRERGETEHHDKEGGGSFPSNIESVERNESERSQMVTTGSEVRVGADNSQVGGVENIQRGGANSAQEGLSENVRRGGAKTQRGGANSAQEGGSESVRLGGAKAQRGGANSAQEGGSENVICGGAKTQRGGAEDDLRGEAVDFKRGGNEDNGVLESGASNIADVGDKKNKKEAPNTGTLEVEEKTKGVVEIHAVEGDGRDANVGGTTGVIVDQHVPQSNARNRSEFYNNKNGNTESERNAKGDEKDSFAGQESITRCGAAENMEAGIESNGGAISVRDAGYKTKDDIVSSTKDWAGVDPKDEDMQMNIACERDVKNGETLAHKEETFVDRQKDESTDHSAQNGNSKPYFERHQGNRSRESDLQKGLIVSASSLPHDLISDSQREALEDESYNVYDEENKRKSDNSDKDQDNLAISCHDDGVDNQIFYSCPPENFSPTRVTFQVGGEDDDEWPNYRPWNSLERRGPYTNGGSPSHRFQEPLHSYNMKLSPTGSLDRQRTGHYGPVTAPGFDSYGRALEKKRGSVDLPRGIFSDHTRTTQPEVALAGRARKRVSIEEPRDRKFLELPAPSSHPNLSSACGKAPAQGSSSDHPVNGGILKHSASAPKQDFGHPPEAREFNTGTMRYRRRSQLALSPDIPIDVPLKHRQLENEVRNKNNLEFIRRRVSLQEDQNFPSSADLKLGNVRELNQCRPPSRNFSFPATDTNVQNAQLNVLRDRPVRKSGLDHLNVPRPGYSHANSTTVHGDYGHYTHHGSKNDPGHGNHHDVYYSPETSEFPSHGSSCDKEPPTARHSREGSIASSNIVIEREIDEADIVDYLGNIHPEMRRFGFPPSPRAPPQGPSSPISSPTTKASRQSGIGNMHGGHNDNKPAGHEDGDSVFSKEDLDDEDDPSMLPYVPIRRERISFHPTAQSGQIWTVRGHDNKAFQAFPDRSPSFSDTQDTSPPVWYSKEAEADDSGTTFTRSRRSSIRSEKRVRIETVPLCIEAGIEKVRNENDGYNHYTEICEIEEQCDDASGEVGDESGTVSAGTSNSKETVPRGSVVLRTYVLSVLMYGSECWTISKEMEKRLLAIEMWFLRRIFRISWTERKTNEEVLHLHGTDRSLLQMIRKRQMEFLGHINRHDGLEKLMLHGKVEGKRARGRLEQEPV
ncbi:hypothetical protein EGW08_003882 [Elysia chlorotica]|uniref:Uncharacterized protein n=1 Tax=Elysia chlorotica TaxID=188477 RepID=A0A433U3K5_ELYCH|nr:hypothetical protein EGW08_003882 [Elysia chlorotica]